MPLAGTNNRDRFPTDYARDSTDFTLCAAHAAITIQGAKNIENPECYHVSIDDGRACVNSFKTDSSVIGDGVNDD